MDKDPGIIGEMFDRIAPTYDRLNMVLSLFIDRIWRRKTIRAMDIAPEQRVLDIATGTGDLAICAIRHASCHVTGIDLSMNMLKQLVAKARTRRDLVSLQGDAMFMPFKDASFDHAMVAFGIRNMANIKDMLTETLRVLKEGGRFGVLEFSLPTNPVFRAIYLMYFKRILPFIGGRVSGNPRAYAYLRDSVMAFERPEDLEDLMRKEGFSIYSSRPMFFGISHLYILEKRMSP
ncbi:MAG: bifunctional demethylmenaquinone methyltransferase/2-methoxy-6-polyprenyl-1,4-benzoquinol methylase UbiE [Thermodesulfobacteriota bacterium]|nr:bifunctional demethylmenaquinone methyltransferase/2-methoxy-6-polyprenyl-1,4-benzoquinol methylase UbiE [Thermodesulfobacteriota bacterium]